MKTQLDKGLELTYNISHLENVSLKNEYTDTFSGRISTFYPKRRKTGPELNFTAGKDKNGKLQLLSLKKGEDAVIYDIEDWADPQNYSGQFRDIFDHHFYNTNYKAFEQFYDSFKQNNSNPEEFFDRFISPQFNVYGINNLIIADTTLSPKRKNTEATMVTGIYDPVKHNLSFDKKRLENADQEMIMDLDILKEQISSKNEKIELGVSGIIDPSLPTLNSSMMKFIGHKVEKELNLKPNYINTISDNKDMTRFEGTVGKNIITEFSGEYDKNRNKVEIHSKGLKLGDDAIKEIKKNFIDINVSNGSPDEISDDRIKEFPFDTSNNNLEYNSFRGTEKKVDIDDLQSNLKKDRNSLQKNNDHDFYL